MNRETVLRQAILPSDSLMGKIGLVAAGTFLVAMGAQVEVPMLPVPMSLQTLAISVIGLTYGARLAAITLMVYLAQGAAGMPVFSGGDAGAAHLFGPTAGYLWGFVGMAWMTGWMAENGFGRGGLRMFLAAFIPATLLFVPGAAWIWAATPLDLTGAIQAGVLPFLVGDVVKSTLAAVALAGGWAAFGGRKTR
ncbi:biotin transporter BioY [Qingshengfaniella alkalisoli]|nr:biotin transporter BioY [Qingshengfaniella alkalisoli]